MELPVLPVNDSWNHIFSFNIKPKKVIQMELLSKFFHNVIARTYLPLLEQQSSLSSKQIREVVFLMDIETAEDLVVIARFKPFLNRIWSKAPQLFSQDGLSFRDSSGENCNIKCSFVPNEQHFLLTKTTKKTIEERTYRMLPLPPGDSRIWLLFMKGKRTEIDGTFNPQLDNFFIQLTAIPRESPALESPIFQMIQEAIPTNRHLF